MLASPRQVFAAHHDDGLLTSFFISLFTYVHIVLSKSIYVHAYFSKCHTSSETDAIGITAAAKSTDLVTAPPKNVTRVFFEVLKLTL